jgi:hypothetical protein
MPRRAHDTHISRGRPAGTVAHRFVGRAALLVTSMARRGHSMDRGPIEPAPSGQDGQVAAAAPMAAAPAVTERREEDHPSDSGWDILLRSVGAVIGPTTALTAILYYFGWARTKAHYIYFAVDQKELGFSTTDYLLRSAAGAFWPVVFLLVVIIVSLWMHSTVNQALRDPELPSWGIRALFACLVVAGVLLAIRGYTGIARSDSRDAIWILFSLWALILLFGVLFATRLAPRMIRMFPNRVLRLAMLLLPLGACAALLTARSGRIVALGQAFGFLLTPLSVAAAVALLSYAVHLSRRPRGADDRAGGSDPRARRLAAITQAIVLLLIGFCLFWFIGAYAGANGNTTAYRTALELHKQTGVVVYSAQRLYITDAPGTHETRLSGTDSAYRFKYTGLRLLAQSKDRYFLLPDGWSKYHPVTIVLPDTNDIRVDLIRGR